MIRRVRQVVCLLPLFAFVAGANRLAAQREPVIKLFPLSPAVGPVDSVPITVIACSYETGDHQMNLGSFQLLVWRTGIEPGYVDRASEFSMTSATEEECDFEGFLSDEIFLKWTGWLVVNKTTSPVIVDAKFLSQQSWLYQENRSYYAPLPRRQIRIVAEHAFAEVPPSVPRVARFSVTNLGNDDATVSVAAPICSGSAFSGNCTRTSAGTIVDLPPDSSAAITVQFSSGGSTGTDGHIAVVVSSHGVADTAWASVSVGNPPSTGVHLAGNSPGSADYLHRGACVRMAVAPNASSECGDLRVVHPLVAVRTMDVARTPTLTYSSANARPTPIVQADLRVSTSLALPSDSITVELARADTALTCGVRKFLAAAWDSSGNVRRIAVPYAGCSTSSGVYRYRVKVTSSNQNYTSTDTSSVFIVNRGSTPLGAGWWLAGHEQLQILSATQLLWIGGDGSVRRYLKSGSV